MIPRELEAAMQAAWDQGVDPFDDALVRQLLPEDPAVLEAVADWRASVALVATSTTAVVAAPVATVRPRLRVAVAFALAATVAGLVLRGRAGAVEAATSGSVLATRFERSTTEPGPVAVVRERAVLMDAPDSRFVVTTVRSVPR
ncbi:MAG: hypothetical protein AAF628_29685 [Planctomycetota bacterium]